MLNSDKLDLKSLEKNDLGKMIEEMLGEMSNEFINHMVPFWMRMSDMEYGGYYGLYTNGLELDKKADKGCILNSRILWMFSNMFSFTGNKHYLSFAKNSYDFMRKYFLDEIYGGVYWSVSYDGKPEDDSKHTYCQSFAIYALASYYDASGDREALELAYKLFDVIETKCRDQQGYLEAFDKEFNQASNEKLSENGVMAARTMNTLLHVMEAYTELYEVDVNSEMKNNYIPEYYTNINTYTFKGTTGRADEVRTKLLEILKIFKEKIYNPEKKRLEVFFDLDYNPIIDLHSFGHDIEASWLIYKTMQVLGLDKIGGTEYDLSDITKVLAETIYDVVKNDSADQFLNGSPAEAEDGKVLETRIWWVQCECMVGFVNAYNQRELEMMLNAFTYDEQDKDSDRDLERDLDRESDKNIDDNLNKKNMDDSAEKYLRAVVGIWNFIKNNMVDYRVPSEWLNEVELGMDENKASNENKVSNVGKPIVDEWKCPYHNGRMFLEVTKRLKSVIGGSGTKDITEVLVSN